MVVNGHSVAAAAYPFLDNGMKRTICRSITVGLIWKLILEGRRGIIEIIIIIIITHNYPGSPYPTLVVYL